MKAKFISESINFERGKDPKRSMGIGNEAHRVASELGIDMAELRSLWEIIGYLEPETETGEENPDKIDFDAHVWMIWDDPGPWGVEKDSHFYEVIEWANKNIDDAWKIFNLSHKDVYEIHESLDFERGQDPKSAMDIGMEPRTFHAGSVRYNRGSTTYLDKKLAKRALRGEDTLYQQYFMNAPGYDNTKGFYIEELQDPKNPYFYIEYDGEIYPVIGKINESVSFERGKDPKDSLKIGLKSRAFPIESVYSGAQWVKGEELKLFLESVLNSNMGGFPEYAQSVRFKKDPNLKTLISEIWHIYELINMGFSGILWNDIFVPFYKPDLKENLEFERGQDPKKAMGIGRVRPYPGMSPKEFANWFEEEILTYGNPGDWGAMADNLFNNDWETDQEVSIYLIDRNMDPELVRELIEMREYFNDSKYLNAIKNSWMDEI